MSALSSFPATSTSSIPATCGCSTSRRAAATIWSWACRRTATAAHLPEKLRLESVRSISTVDHAFILRAPPEKFVARLQPAVVVKGKEHEAGQSRARGRRELWRQAAVHLRRNALLAARSAAEGTAAGLTCSNIAKPRDYPNRHGFSFQDLTARHRALLQRCKVVVIGDLIVDEYINCAAARHVAGGSDARSDADHGRALHRRRRHRRRTRARARCGGIVLLRSRQGRCRQLCVRAPARLRRQSDTCTTTAGRLRSSSASAPTARRCCA